MSECAILVLRHLPLAQASKRRADRQRESASARMKLLPNRRSSRLKMDAPLGSINEEGKTGGVPRSPLPAVSRGSLRGAELRLYRREREFDVLRDGRQETALVT